MSDVQKISRPDAELLKETELLRNALADMQRKFKELTKTNEKLEEENKRLSAENREFANYFKEQFSSMM